MTRNGIVSQVRPEIRNLTVYQVKELDSDIIFADKNENPYDIPVALKKKVLDYALERSWSRYPPIVAKDLYRRIAEYTGWVPEGVVAGNGSDEMILTMLLSFLGPGKKLVTPTPSFAMYPYVATLVGADTVYVPLNHDFTFDYDAIEETFLREGDMLVICSPNNPTGNLFARERLERLLSMSGKPVILDEAYYEFSRVTALDLVETCDNLIIFRTFSKAFSMAGLRLGYALMAPALAAEIGKVKIPFNINFFSLAAAATLLENRKELEKTMGEIVKERDSLFEAMKTIEGIVVYPSSANFILFKTGYESENVFEKILKNGVMIRNLSRNPLLKNTLRVTVSKKEDNVKFIESLKNAMNELREG